MSEEQSIMLNRVWAWALALAFATSPALAHDNEHVLAPGPYETELGVPGDASDVISTVRVRMLETAEGRMAFDPAVFAARRGETKRIVVENAGASAHEFILGTYRALTEHSTMMRDMPEMRHDDPNALWLQPGASGEIIWKFGVSDRIEFACLVPGHFEAGMRGRVLATVSSPDEDDKTSPQSSHATRWAKRTRWAVR